MSSRILVVWDTYPRPDFNAGERRLVAMLRLLARSHRVDYVATAAVREHRVAVGSATLRAAGVTVLGDGWNCFARALCRRPYDLILFESYPAFAAHANYVRERQPTAALVIDSVDVHFAREAAAAAVGDGSSADAAATRERELAAYRAADAVITASADDADVLKREGRMPPLFVVPVIVDAALRDERPRAPIALFVGGFSHPPNADAVRWFVKDVWPLVHRAVPGSVFQVVGSNVPPDVVALAGEPGVQVLGYVEDLAPLLDAAAVSVAPLRYGAGMKGKVVEAMAAGLPVVTTSFGVQGLPVVPGVHAAVAADAEEFARSVAALFADPGAARRMATAANALVETYGPERVAGVLQAMVAAVTPRHSRMNSRLRWTTANLAAFVRLAGRAVGLATPPPRV